MQTIKQMKTETLWKIHDQPGIDRKSKLLLQCELVRREGPYVKRVYKAVAKIIGDRTVFKNEMAITPDTQRPFGDINNVGFFNIRF